MGILKQNRRATLLVAAGVALALIAVPLLLKGSHDDNADKGGNQGGSVVGTTTPDPSDTDILQPSSPAKKKKQKPAKDDAAASQVTTSSGGLAVTETSGLTGHGGSQSATRHRVVLTVTSAEDVPTAVGWWVPTSRGDEKGGTKYVGRSWSRTTIAYGLPDYARLLVQTGRTGAPITCTITVDGKVTDRRTTPGPYGSVVCQG